MPKLLQIIEKSENTMIFCVRHLITLPLLGKKLLSAIPGNKNLICLYPGIAQGKLYQSLPHNSFFEVAWEGCRGWRPSTHVVVRASTFLDSGFSRSLQPHNITKSFYILYMEVTVIGLHNSVIIDQVLLLLQRPKIHAGQEYLNCSTKTTCTS